MATMEVTTDTFEEEVIEHKDQLVLVDFWASWCGPCKTIGPIVEKIAAQMSDSLKVCKVNVEDNQEIAGKYNVRGIPTLLLFKNGEIVESRVGAVPEEDILGMVKAYS